MTEEYSQKLSNSHLEERARRVRVYGLRMAAVPGKTYIGQILALADVLAVCYFHALSYKPEDPEWEGRDRFFLSHGHLAIAQYGALIEAGILPEDEIETRLNKLRSPFRTAETFWIEEIIDARKTRPLLVEFVNLAAPARKTGKVAFTMRP